MVATKVPLSKRKITVLTYRALAEIVESMAADLGAAEESLADLTPEEDEMVEQQAMKIARLMKTKANQLERGF